MESNIIFFDEKKNKSGDILKRIVHSARSFYWRRALKGLAGTAILFIAIFYLINADLKNLCIKAQSFWRADSVRRMEISDEWITRYNVVLNDKMRTTDDTDADGIIFSEEQYYNTNPFRSDTDGDGISDGEEVKKGNNPLGAGELDTDGDSLPDNWEKANNSGPEADDADSDPDNDSLANIDEYFHGTDPNNADTDSDGYGDRTEIGNGFDPAAPGDAKPAIIILSEKINLVAPVIWSKSEDETRLQEDLKNGVVHYPQTGVPGEIGNSIIAGHSSNYVWAKGDYNSIFRNLNSLDAGDRVVVRVIQQNGKTFDYQYTISEKRVVQPDDEWIFESGQDKPTLTLSTCWPIGTAISRLAIRAEMI